MLFFRNYDKLFHHDLI